ncbi:MULTISPECIES: hypothetical protein [unclassified Pseudoxanthomonas]|uniref:hypothetical protein n=1 Tax=unclassified Pseudoxanthomonas TaxID=2645906 RepID=UPI0008E857D2|nr:MULTISPECIES: hypothetical protein [unclassified Pseudoxanthomonas]PPJ43865.1 hypothetical protein C0063_12035 [Pseudoxanthomonas sp. KAs_5_3]SFV36423.1 hypothetical protein SAMN05428990_3484 [Pseudoxanthomonas sp. YR558]
MSYDLYFKPRNGSLDRAAFEAYFAQNPLFQVDDAEVAYQNEATGTYFSFGWQIGALQDEDEGAESSYPIGFNLNFFRPSTFALEAAPHLTALVRAFDLVVLDLQAHGMGEGDFSVDGFLSGWNAANAWAISHVIEEHGVDEHGGLFPQSEIHRTWQWNLHKAQREAALEQRGIDRFVPTRMYARVEGQVGSMMVWPDGIPFESAPTDYVLVVREELAPRSFLRSRPDRVLVPWSDLRPVIELHGATDADGVVALSFERVPRDVANFVRKLPARDAAFTVLSPDRVLDAEHAPNAAME